MASQFALTREKKARIAESQRKKVEAEADYDPAAPEPQNRAVPLRGDAPMLPIDLQNQTMRERVASIPRSIASGLGADMTYANRLGEDAANFVDFAPLLGDAVGVDDTIQSAKRGDWWDTGINAAGSLAGVAPVGGDILGKAIKSLAKKGGREVVADVGKAAAKVPAAPVTRDDIAKVMPPPRDFVPDDPQSVTKKDYSNPDRVLDPERFHLAGGGVKMDQPFSEMTYKTEPTGGVEAPPQKALDPADLQGGVGIATLGDKTRNFETLVDVNGIPLTRKQKLEGGYRFGDEFPGSIWAGEQVPMGKIMEKAQEVGKGGKRVFGVPVVQGSEGGDAARMMTGPLIDLMKQAELTPDAKAFLDKAMAAELTGKKGGTRWPGIEEVLANGDEWMANVSMNDRAALAKMMRKSGHANPRVPVAALTKAITAPDLLNRPALTTGMNVGEFNLEKGLTRADRHGTYPVEAAGTSLGRVGAMPYDWMFQTHGAGLKGKDLAQAQRTVMTQIPTQEFDQEWLDNLMARIEGYQR